MVAFEFQTLLPSLCQCAMPNDYYLLIVNIKLEKQIWKFRDENWADISSSFG